MTTFLRGLAQAVVRFIGERTASERRALIAISLALVAAVGLAGLVLGYETSQHAIPYKLRTGLQQWISAQFAPKDEREVTRTTMRTNYHMIQIDRLPIGRAWSIEQAGQNIIFATRLGRFGYLDSDLRMQSLDLQAPMNLEGLRGSELGQSEYFEISRFRTTDLLIQQDPGGHYNLYAAHHLYDDAGCIRMAVSRASVRSNEAGLVPISRDWERVYTSRDCVRAKNLGAYFAGDQSGGRLVLLNPEHLALSIGDFQFDGVNSEHAVSQDPNSDLGKIIEINLVNGRARVLASGLRNPQGLLLSRSGELIETEHGPQGGDEVNVIREGADYGWPSVTYGTRYANRPIHWPLSRTPEFHDGYERPLYVFTPSIAISNLIEPNLDEFPNWRDTLIVSSLKNNMLYVLRREEGRVAFAEPILIEGVRIRDIISLADGRIAIAGDEGDLQIISNAETPERHLRRDVVTGYETMPAALAEETGDVQTPERWGALMFGLYCSQCHSVTDEVRVGPPLAGVIGRRVGSYPGYEYSQALRGQDDVWSRERLARFVRDPDAVYPGVAMDKPYMTETELDQILHFLASRQAQPASQNQ